MKQINVYLLRHGKTLGEPALNGQTDVLVEESLQLEISRRIASSDISFSQVYSSPLRRCYDLAKLVTTNNKERVLNVNPNLSEMDFGIYDGVEFNSLEKHQWQPLEEFWKSPASAHLPNGEKLEQFNQRCIEAWHSIIDDLSEETLIIAHGGTIRMILAHVLNVDWANPQWVTSLGIDNQSISHIQVTFDGSNHHFLVKSIGVTL
ncbi:histidine phosphatase family protein [Vibrio sp. WJH972]